MPELQWRYGYLLVLGLMLTICVSLYMGVSSVPDGCEAVRRL